MESDERLREELDQHVALQTEENVRFGMSPHASMAPSFSSAWRIPKTIRTHYAEA